MLQHLSKCWALLLWALLVHASVSIFASAWCISCCALPSSIIRVLQDAQAELVMHHIMLIPGNIQRVNSILSGHEHAIPTCACGAAEVLPWPASATVPPALSAQLHCLAEPALLKALVQLALPVPSSPSTAASLQQANTVRSLCNMLQGVTAIPALCQKTLIFTAGPADFVKRLWTSYLKVWVVAVSLPAILLRCALCSLGYAMPCTVRCRCRST